ncbi:efflux RND transporter permease subunit [Gloeobacter kilaueensis]|uniref:Heavy metal efflux pump, CzcA family n=1 Tax=Gloeobacter kilaueensis (strain ATCC BAA-2537 / CCAP 1431/1 / ULC 316 / JS1) TaxID=1183438 RepID=U5QIN5_GLOK1|nr:CusA/CzcA family heavy metal efflux RND transporter [Gloeobacter kilaueensis]AGY58812.1 heavy metal efflux pump, CzcA family [Gloeobacter kilaueensis JS1]
MNKLIDNLITLALRHRYVTVAVALVLLVAGYWAFRTLETEAYPEFTDPKVRVITILPGKGAEEVERLVTIPLEKELGGIPNETSLRSISFLGLSVVSVTFEDGTPTTLARQQVLERVNQADIPDDAKPELDPDAGAIGEIYRYTVESKYYSPTELKAIEDWQLEKAFRQIPGVIDVTSFGGPVKTYQVNIDPGRLRAFSLTLDQVFQALANSNETVGGNYIENNGQAYVVRGLGLLRNIDDIDRVVVTAAPDGTPIRIKDVAAVEIGAGVRLGQFGKNLEDDAVMGIVLMRRGENPSRVIERLYEKFPQIQQALPSGVRLVPLYDRNQLVRETLDTIGHNVAEGVVLVVVVLIVFLFDITSGLVTAAVIPLALLFAFICLNLCRIPANLLSLGAIDFGIIVDGAVVMVENAFRRLSEEGRDLDWLDRSHLVLEGAKQVGRPILFATGIIISCFVPIFTFSGVAGKLFRPLAFTMNFALLGAVLVALTIIPVLVLFFMTRRPLIERESPVVSWARRLYKPTLGWVLAHPWPVILAVVAAIAMAVVLFFNTGSEFLPALDEGNIWLRATMLPTSVSLENAVATAQRIRLIVMRYPEIKNVTSQTGSPDDGTDPNLFSNIEFLVDLKPTSQWRPRFHGNKEELIEAMNRDLSVIPNVLYNFSQYIQDNVDEAISGAKGEVGIKIFGPDIRVLQRLGDAVATIVAGVPGMVDVADDKMLGQPQYQIVVDRDAAARYGINVSDIDNLVQTAVGGRTATQLAEGERRFNVFVRFARPFRNSQIALDNLLVDPPGPVGPIPLAQVAHVEAVTGAAIINREDNSRRMIVKANVRGRDLGSSVSEAQQKVSRQVQLPAGYQIVWGGQYQYQQESNQRLLVILPLTLALIFVILLFALGSAANALLILVAVPLAALGGVLGLFVTHTYFSISAGVGFIALSGVAVQNGVILVSYINQLRREGLPAAKAVYEGALTRMRPVLMTATVAILGLVPAALSNGIGSQSQKPFAIVIIGGLISATVLTLLVLPTLYQLFAREQQQAEL